MVRQPCRRAAFRAERTKGVTPEAAMPTTASLRPSMETALAPAFGSSSAPSLERKTEFLPPAITARISRSVVP